MPVRAGAEAAMTPYELAREENIRRNGQILRAIGLVDTKTTPKTVKKRTRSQLAVESDSSPQRRSLRSALTGNTDLDRSHTGPLIGESSRDDDCSSSTNSRSQPAIPQGEVGDIASDGVRRTLPPSSQEFARRVLKCINRIPVGKVASYGQLAAMGGLPRNSRQVGSMLKEGLCSGGSPWWRVINAAGKISLLADGGGDLQRQKLEAEGVHFRDNGAVDDDTVWDP
jgi:methylated-DNA-protein-cysteine methyltransferase-like protein